LCGLGRELVDDYLIVLGDEQLDGERARELEATGQPQSKSLGIAWQPRG
jgi:hypothetical protein